MLAPRRRFVAVLAFVSVSVGFARHPEVRAETASGIDVRIIENATDPWSRPTDGKALVETYRVPALGIVRTPIKYNARGIEVDRSVTYHLHASTTLQIAPGPKTFYVRSRGYARLVLDGKVLAENKPIKPNASGHDPVPEAAPPFDERVRWVATGDQEGVAKWTSDGKPHRLELWATIGGKSVRSETGELSVSIAEPGGLPILVGGTASMTLTDEGWENYAASERRRLTDFDTHRRRLAASSEDALWKERHEIARRVVGPLPSEEGVIDRHIDAKLVAEKIKPAPLADDATFFRRLALDTIGVVPDSKETEAFLADRRPDKRSRAIDARLADPRWADAWMGYWQDVLGENPGILKPTLNNTGPFRKYLHSAFLDGKSFDRFVAELIRMEGSPLGGGPAGFGLATQNDAPMAAKAYVVAKAFLAADMKCARCHDAPRHPYDQSDLFSLAGLLDRKPQTIPLTSTVRSQPGGRRPAVTVSLKAGDVVQAGWTLADVCEEKLPEGYPVSATDPRERLAALITSPMNQRFGKVIANRLWKRYMGVGIVEPVDDWDAEGATPSHPELLDDLAKLFVASGYDLKYLARLIFRSNAYRREVRPDASDSPGGAPERRFFATPARRRMSAEQLVDSLFAVANKGFNGEELNLDPDGRRPAKEFLNLGVPTRAWEFTSTSNERDRPALSLPVTQSLVDVLQAFGWRPSRQDPITVREEAVTPIQPAILANGVISGRITRLSDDSAFTELSLKDQPAAALIRSVYLRVLSREPSADEVERLVGFLSSSYTTRIVPGAKPRPKGASEVRRVSWSNHLSPEATRIQLEMEKAVRAGDPPTAMLSRDFRERMEDIVWALINSPEFVFLP